MLSCEVFKCRILATIVVALLACTMSATNVSAQTENDKADSKRKLSEAKAEGKLGYPNAYDLYVGGSGSPVDFQALSHQIARMAALIQAFGQSMQSVVPSGQAVSDVRAIYGPDGATAESVRVFLEYRLMVAGNPRLKVGKVTEDDNQVYAQVVTKNGALVDEFAIDKKSGAWIPQR